jgi:hypothetical protein
MGGIGTNQPKHEMHQECVRIAHQHTQPSTYITNVKYHHQHTSVHQPLRHTSTGQSYNQATGQTRTLREGRAGNFLGKCSQSQTTRKMRKLQSRRRRRHNAQASIGQVVSRMPSSPTHSSTENSTSNAHAGEAGGSTSTNPPPA